MDADAALGAELKEDGAELVLAVDGQLEGLAHRVYMPAEQVFSCGPGPIAFEELLDGDALVASVGGMWIRA